MPRLTPIGNTRFIKPSTTIQLLQDGRVIPILSDQACFDLALHDYQAFLLAYGEYVEYPLADKEYLARITKYLQFKENLSDVALKSDYLHMVKTYIYYLAQGDGIDDDLLAEAEEQINLLTVSKFANLLDYPRFDGGQNNLLLKLANYPLKIYLTTSPYRFIEKALERAGKTPRTEICRWRRELDSIDSKIDDGYRPSPDEPLVYHLHGLDDYPDSLVLTEDDYLEFLVNVVQGQGNNAIDRIHALIRKALSDDLIVLGYQLNSWAFRTLYSGLIKPNGKNDNRGTCCLQLVNDNNEKKYLQDYVQREAKFEISWGTLQDYARKLPNL